MTAETSLFLPLQGITYTILAKVYSFSQSRRILSPKFSTSLHKLAAYHMLESGSCESSVDLRMWIGTHPLRRRQPILKRLRAESGGQLDIYKRETRSVNFITMAGNQAGVVRGRETASAWEVSPLGEELALFQLKKGRVFSNFCVEDSITYKLPVQQRDTYCTEEARNCYNSFREFWRRPHSLINDQWEVWCGHMTYQNLNFWKALAVC